MASDATIKSRRPLSSVPTDLQTARNRLALAIRNHTTTLTQAALDEVQAAQAEVFQLEDQYREGYLLLLERASAKQRRPS